ncbi:MAG: Peptidoglycan glycosyltransferase [Ramlibacter sp.]|uniref:transglycosylase domain-containing protein n=1 Tax=Ramlibacter sp. TaxID=1917967 RepID=UPI002620A0D6|nr:transglycosylase domain-containing protein [Ramlibacter sp.]MDB5752623.1 Peptidoglycan glycosyltransferase [Ramlibacter sp.]
MKAALVRTSEWAGTTLRRGWEAVRRHPWRTALLIPALVPAAALVYALVLLPFTPSIGDIKKAKQESPSVVLSADGKELAVFKRANRDWVKLSEISPKAIEALLATEDRRFYDHMGIDLVRTAKAAVNTVRGDRQGGSTLTQQLARNLYPEEIGRAPTITRKIKEAITALKIEAVYSKDEILESYLNSVSFLYNAWGIEMAARTYFDKPAGKLDELEAATLVGMLKGTSYYNPVLNPERALERRNTVLAQMVKEGKLPTERYAQLKAQPLKLDFARLPEFSGPAPHLAEHLRRWLIEWADDNDYNIYADGLVVRTTIDSRLQELANEAVARQGEALQAVADVEWSRSSAPSLGINPEAFIPARAKAQPFDYFWGSRPDLLDTFIRESAEYKAAREQGLKADAALAGLKDDDKFIAALKKNKTMLQAGFLAIEPSTGHVKAWVGSRDYAHDKFDHVQQARRQPGSTFKPFVYGAAFDQGIQPNETFIDGPVAIQIDKGQVWRPGDVGGPPTNQPMTLREGLARSKNTITAQLMMRVGPARVAALAQAMGVRQSPLQAVPSLALGTSPVTLKEMVTAFGSIANGGRYIPPVLVTAIEDRDRNLKESFHAPASEQALSNQAAMTLLDVLRGVVEQGTAVGLKSRFGLAGDLAGKTGTTQDNTDGWFILMHPQLVAGSWVGFNDNRVTMRSEYWGQGSHNALLMVGDFFQGSTKAKLVDPKSVFAAPRLQDQERPLLQQMGDWWNSVFTPASADPAVVTIPEAQPEPPPLEAAPASPSTPYGGYVGSAPAPLGAGMASGAPAVLSDAPVVVSGPERLPALPRPLESGRPAETVPGTQVYSVPATVGRPATNPATGAAAVLVPRSLQQDNPPPRVLSAPTPAMGGPAPASSAPPIASATGSASSAGFGAVAPTVSPNPAPVTSGAGSSAPAAATGSATGSPTSTD